MTIRLAASNAARQYSCDDSCDRLRLIVGICYRELGCSCQLNVGIMDVGFAAAASPPSRSLTEFGG